MLSLLNDGASGPNYYTSHGSDPFDHTEEMFKALRVYVAKSVMWRSAFLAISHQQTSKPNATISSRLRARAGTSLVLCLPSIASTVWAPLLHKLPVPGFHLQIGLSVDVDGVNRDVAQPGADGIDIYSGTQKVNGGGVAYYSTCGIVDTVRHILLEDGYDIRTIQEFTGTH